MKILHFQHMGVGVILAEEQRRQGVDAMVLALAPHPFGFREDALLPLRSGPFAKIQRLVDWSMYFGYEVFHNHDNCYIPSAARLRWKGAFVQHYHDPSTQKPIGNADLTLASLPSLTRLAQGAVWIPLPARMDMFSPSKRQPHRPIRIGYCQQDIDPKKPQMIPRDAILAVVAQSGGLAEAYPLTGLWSQDQMPDYYAQIDIWVDRIGCDFYGFAAIEAAAMGIPVVTQIGARDREFVPTCPFVSTGWVEAEATLLGLIFDAEQREEIGRRGRAFVLDVHDSVKIARMTIECYQQLMKGTRP